MPTGRGATWARMGRPSATAASMRPSRSRQASGWRWLCASERDSGTPVRATMARTNSNSPSVSGKKSEMSSTTPWPASATPWAMHSSSSVLARSEGVGSPLAVRWLRVREVEKPRAPSRMASVARARMAAQSSGSPPPGGPPARPSRRGAARRAAAGRTGRCRAGDALTASRYSPKLSHSQSMPSSSTAPGMSSTPSISEMRRGCASGRTGAKPTPQLPMTAVVTPCQLDGAMRSSQVAWPS